MYFSNGEESPLNTKEKDWLEIPLLAVVARCFHVNAIDSIEKEIRVRIPLLFKWVC